MDNKYKSTEIEKKKAMTDEERLALAAKLDKELDEFIDKLPKKKYEDGWPEDRWEEEMAKHPFFMKEPPKPGMALHPLYEGLQQLKYDPEENDPEELAQNYKEDGNYNFKYKNYRLAVIAYTEGIKVKCGNSSIEANLLNNRAAAHYFLKNYRSSLKDCELALKLNPDYDRPLIRAANCCFQLKQFVKAVEFCNTILGKQKNNNDIQQLRQKCITAAKLEERNKRKSEYERIKREKEEKNLIKEILIRGYNIEGGLKGTVSLKEIEPHFPELMHNRVSLDDYGNLIWPVVFVYPEYKIMDYIQEFHENNTFLEQVSHIFESVPEWDKENKYKPENLNMYYETSKCHLISIDVNKTLKDVLQSKEFLIKAGTPSIIIFVRESLAEEQFIKNY